MRYPIALVVLALLAAGCGSPSSAKHPASTAVPTAHIATIPATTPPPTPKGGFPTANPHASPVKLPTVETISMPTATPFPAGMYTASLHGQVTDARTHSPLAGAIILLQVSNKGHESVTNSFGRYHLSFPAGAAVGLTVKKTGYVGWLGMGKLGSHQSLTLNIPLQPLKPGKTVAPPPPAIFGKM